MSSPSINIQDGRIVLKQGSNRLSFSIEEGLTVATQLRQCAEEEQRKSKIDRLSKYIDEMMKRITASEFIMGVDNGDSYEGPSHFVEISKDFYISLILIDQRLYSLVMDENPSVHQGIEQPVDSVSWYDSLRFCNALSTLLGYERCYDMSAEKVIWHQDRNGFRLPTEAEWFTSAAAGENCTYAGGDDLSKVSSWKPQMSHAPASKNGIANGNGLFDMSGMCFSWCFDFFAPFEMSRQFDPIGPPDAEQRVCRGGAWNRNAWFSRLAFRCGMDPMLRYDNVGIRLVRNVDSL
jgi:formylglycine-generating enzyme required for sulfatase activity